MKNIFIVLLVVALVVENVYIYLHPETFCQEVHDKADEWKSQLIPEDLANKWKEEIKDEVRKEMEAELDSIIPTH